MKMSCFNIKASAEVAALPVSDLQINLVGDLVLGAEVDTAEIVLCEVAILWILPPLVEGIIKACNNHGESFINDFYGEFSIRIRSISETKIEIVVGPGERVPLDKLNTRETLFERVEALLQSVELELPSLIRNAGYPSYRKYMVELCQSFRTGNDNY